MLQARSLSVEVGGRLTLADASFSLRAGDKVGLVGRNGVGKTSLLKVLAGEAPAAGGVVLRSDATRLPPPGPASPAVRASTPAASSHVLSGRDLDDGGPPARGAARPASTEDPSDRNVARFARAEERVQPRGRVRRRVGGPAPRARPRSAPRPPRPPARPRSPVVSAAGSSWPASCSPGSELLLLDEPTNHLDTDAKQWLLGFLRVLPGRAPRRQPRPRPARRGASPASCTSTTPSSPSTAARTRSTSSARAADEERLRRVVAHAAESRSSGSRRSPTRCAARPSSGRSTPRRSTRASPACGATRSTGPQREKRIAVRFPEPPRPGAVVLHVDELDEGLRRAAGVHRRDVRRRPGRAAARHGPQRRRQDELMRLLAGQTEADAGSVELGHDVSVGLLRAGARGHRRRARRALDHLREQVAVARPGRCAACSARSACAARSRSRTRARCRAARRRSSRSRSSSPAGTTRCCSTSRPTTSTRRRATRSATRCAAGRARSCS